ncbi:MAG: hypothetical protein E7370_05775 [Clostridiales bacterium]|nr:hypothetical protein [Clostridiales bacterium]
MALNVNRKVLPDVKYLSDKAFYAVIGATLLLGFAINAIEVTFFAQYFATWNPMVFFIVYFVSAIVGVCLNVFSQKPAISFIGYLLVVAPIGMALSLVVPATSIAIVRSAVLATVLLSAIFIILAIAYPKFFSSLFRVLSLSLIVALVFQLIAIFTGFGNNSFLDWIVVLIFSCYVGADVAYATRRPKTLDGAIDSACGIYLDLVNIFIRLLAILSRRR